MPLLDLWKTNPKAMSAFTIEQVVSSAGDGQLRDGSVCSAELRAFLSEVPTPKLFEYVDRCLIGGFVKSGQVLQDLVNEVGRRLDYKVERGLYQGKTNAIGFDGLWIAPDGHGIVIEVKTTDAYRISLDTIAKYRSQLIAQEKVSSNSSHLIVVGRQDTGDIEAQVRGSRHAWDTRLISVDALRKLVFLKEAAGEEDTLERIRGLLRPFEYTRLDNMIDVMFATAKDVEAGVGADDADPEEGSASSIAPDAQPQKHTPTEILQSIRGRIVAAMAPKLGSPLIAHKRALYRSADGTKRIACAVSKFYERSGYYWYAYHPGWEAFLADGTEAFFVLGCVDRDIAFALPHAVIKGALESLNTTAREDGKTYWHVILQLEKSGDFALVLPKKSSRVSLAEFKFDLPSE